MKLVLQYLGAALITLLALPLFAQDISFSNTVAPEIHVCAESETFNVSFTNTSAGTFSNVSVTVNFPTGISYVAGSLNESSTFNVQESNISNLSAVTFSMNNIPSNGAVSFDIGVEAGFAAIAHQQAGNIFRNNVIVDYTLNSIASNDNEQTDPYNILIPALSITKVEKMAETVFVGQTYTRKVTIVNGGYGKLSSFTLKDVFDAAILTLDGSNVGTVDAANGEITLSTTDFNGTGNGDNWFERNESIVITQTITATGCDDTQSQLYAFWGCDGSTTNSNNKFPYTTVNLYAPNISTKGLPTFNTCMDVNVPNLQTIMITNTGSGPANDLKASIYNTKDNGFDQNVYTRIDENSIQYKVNTGGSLVALTPTQTFTTNSSGAFACLGNNAIGKVEVDLPVLQSGDTIYLQFNTFTCDNINSCDEVNLIGWDYTLTYTDMCNKNSYTKSNQTGQDPKNKEFSVFAEFPSDMVNGQTEEFTFRLTSTTYDMPQGNGAYFEVTFDLPDGLVFSGNSSDLIFQGSNATWPADAVVYDAANKKITGKYLLPNPINLLNSEFRLNLTADCSQPNAASGNVSVDMQLFYIMDDSCTPIYRFPLTCLTSTTTLLHCPSGGACVGMAFQSFGVERTSVGLADNNQDGLPDASGSLNANEIRLNRVMATDTFKTTFTGTVHTAPPNNNWKYGYGVSTIPNGSMHTVIGASVTIFDASANTTLSCNNVPFTTATYGNDLIVTLDFSRDALNGTCGGFNGFKYNDNDVVTLTVHYKAGNIGTNVQQITITNEYYMSDVANPTNNANKFQCDTWNGNFTLIGYQFSNYNTNSWTANSCNRNVHQYFRFRMGNGPETNNLFPYEYRNWGILKKARVEVPDGYTVVSTRFRQYRTQYTNKNTTETTNNFLPISVTPTPNGKSYVYNLENLYKANGGTINASDDGFHGYLLLTLQPVCTLPIDQYEDLEWYFDFQESTNLGGNVLTNVAPTTQDRIRHRRAEFTVSSIFQTVEGIAKTVNWDIKVKNSNQANANNTFLTFSSNNSNIVVTEVINLATNQPVQKQGDIFLLGNINRNNTKNYRIVAEYNSCGLEQLDVYVGYDCNGYPANSNNYVCGYETFPLYVDPQPSELQVRIKGETPLDPCENRIMVNVEMSSVKIAHIKDLFVTVEVPNANSLSLDGDSSRVIYPIGTDWRDITTPTINSNVYSFTTAMMDATIDSDGMPGVTDITKNTLKLRFEVDMNNGFMPGDRIRINVGANKICGDALPTISLEYDPNAVFDRIEGVGLDGSENNWSTSWADYNNDGLVDLFLTNYETDQANQLYKNNGDGTFSKIDNINVGTDLASSTAATWGDYDNDGDVDLFIANNIGFKNFLYRNNGNGTFTRIQNDPIVNDIGYAHGAAWADYDNDGYLDMFTADFFATRFNALYHNNGDGTFTKVNSSPVVTEAASSVNGVWGDYDNDGDVDLFVSNTNDEDNSLYRNDGGGNFVRMTGSIVSNDGGKSVGASWGDYDNDGKLDLFVANAGGQNNFLYRNNGNGSFTKITAGVVVNSGGNSHGSAWADLDNDGDLDLFVGNDNDENNFLYSNNGDGTFTLLDNAITQDAGKSFGSAWADIDNDGDVDLFIANHDNEENFIYENERGRCYNKACVTLVGSISNASAVGAKIRVKANVFGKDIWQMREITAQSGGGIGGQNQMKAFIGIGNAQQIDSMIIEWPSGIEQYYGTTDVSNCSMTFVEPNGSVITGKIFFDENKNCTQDAGELGIPNQRVIIQPGNKQTYTDSTGTYRINVQPGTYTVHQVTDQTWEQYCPNNDGNHTVNVTGVGNTFTGFNFADTAACELPDLSLTLSTTALRVGFESLVAINYQNNGSKAATNTTVSVDFGDDVIPASSTVNWASQNGNIYTWDFATLPFGTDKTIYVEVDVAANAIIGDTLTISGSISGIENDCDALDNVYTLREEAVGAIDPNDILVSPEGIVAINQELTYTIRFQNVGNLAVQRVVLRDTLPQDLDMSTFIRGAASHPYKFFVEDERILVWEFDNINLPDSATNEVASNGFVTFRITPKQDLKNGTNIPNKAAIYFDFAAPVITNTVVNTIGVPGNFDKGEIMIYPNPMTEFANILLVPTDGQPDEEIREFTLFNSYGTPIMRETGLSGIQLKLGRRQLAAGYYFVTIRSNKGQTYTKKLAVF